MKSWYMKIQEQQSMSIVKKRAGRFAGVAVVGVLLMATPAAPGIAAGPKKVQSVCQISGYTPTSVVIGAKVVHKKFTPTVTGCTIQYYQVWLNRFVSDGDDNDGIAWQAQPAAVLDPHYLINAWAGKRADGATVYASGTEDPTEDGDYDVTPAKADLAFQILRRATFGTSFGASPEPVKKGKKITLKATLKRVDLSQYKTLSYVGFAKAPVQVQFKATGASKYKTVKTVKTAKGGKVSTTIKATKSGKWRLYFAGYTTTSATTSAVDGLKVK
jgi:hypothetical protein